MQFFVINMLQLLIYALLLLEKIHHTPKTFNETTKLQIEVFKKIFRKYSKVTIS